VQSADLRGDDLMNDDKRLTIDALRLAIMNRVDALAGSRNLGHLDHTDGVLRGLLWALTGDDPGTYVTSDMRRLFDRAGIQYAVLNDGSLRYA
jgi:hypothetical protein